MKSLPIIVFNLLIFFSFKLSGQALPIDEKTGKVIYTEVVQVNGVAQKELYARALHWFKTYFPNPASVLKEQDTINGRISAQHGINIFKTLAKGERFNSGQVRYSIEVQVKEGRYKYQIDDIFKLATPKVYIEAWLDESSPDKETQLNYVRQVDTHIRDVISKLKEAMARPVQTESSDDW